MRKYFFYAGLICALLSASLHVYLSKRSYELRAGTAEESLICGISEKINCDSALLSSYSEVLGLSLSVFGFALNLALGFILLGLFLQWIGEAFWKNFSIYLSGFIATVSLAMIGISLYHKLYCPVCWTTYVLSFIGFFAVYKAFKKSRLSGDFILEALKDKRSWLFAGISLGGAFFLHIFFMAGLGLKDIEKTVKTTLIDWRREEPFPFTAPALLTLGQKPSFMHIVEFADFLCPHCKKAHPYIEKFLRNHPQVSFSFYAYPLDSQCNKEIPFSNQGLSCDLAKLAFCANEQNVNITTLIFNRQKDLLQSLGDIEKIQKIKLLILKDAQLQEADIAKCLDDKATHTFLKQQIEEGIKANIPGTPSVFVNGKRLRGGSLIQALQALYKELK